MPAVSITVPTLHSLLQESVNLEEEMEERFTPPADSKEEVVKREWGEKTQCMGREDTARGVLRVSSKARQGRPALPADTLPQASVQSRGCLHQDHTWQSMAHFALEHKKTSQLKFTSCARLCLRSGHRYLSGSCCQRWAYSWPKHGTVSSVILVCMTAYGIGLQWYFGYLWTNLPKPHHTTPITSPFHPCLAERAEY